MNPRQFTIYALSFAIGEKRFHYWQWTACLLKRMTHPELDSEAHPGEKTSLSGWISLPFNQLNSWSIHNSYDQLKFSSAQPGYLQKVIHNPETFLRRLLQANNLTETRDSWFRWDLFSWLFITKINNSLLIRLWYLAIKNSATWIQNHNSNIEEHHYSEKKYE